MDNQDFWEDVNRIADNGFTPEGLQKLDYYADLYISGKLLFKRFSPQEQHGCAAGGSSHVIATILAGTEAPADPRNVRLSDFKRELQQAAHQKRCIEEWAKAVGIWIDDAESFLATTLGEEIAEGGEAKVYDNGSTLIKSIGLDYYLLPVHALDRITLHNTYFPETALEVIGFGNDAEGNFKIIVVQQYIEGYPMTLDEISGFIQSLGFRLMNPRNWTYATPEIYLSDMHDENLIRSKNGNIFVIDCDIRINTPELKQGGIRRFTNEISLPD